jgi:hypothetical protein
MFNIDRKRPCCGARPGAVEPVLFSINERSCRAGAEWRRGLPRNAADQRPVQVPTQFA